MTSPIGFQPASPSAWASRDARRASESETRSPLARDMAMASSASLILASLESRESEEVVKGRNSRVFVLHAAQGAKRVRGHLSPQVGKGAFDGFLLRTGDEQNTLRGWRISGGGDRRALALGYGGSGQPPGSTQAARHRKKYPGKHPREDWLRTFHHNGRRGGAGSNHPGGSRGRSRSLGLGASRPVALLPMVPRSYGV